MDSVRGPTGMWLGVQLGSPAEGWAGIYAESPDETVMLYHPNLVIPAYTIANIATNSFNTGLYVQTYNGQSTTSHAMDRSKWAVTIGA